ncbi:MAG: FAD-binding oxidoreductase [Acidobacteria bacterium]|nr:FAD-binding oxidoreductase [Acidobacteriota bacterium]
MKAQHDPVAVLGAGIMGTCTALWLARRGVPAVVFDEAAAPLSGASRWNEGKIHLGYLYAAAPSLDTARVLIPGGLAFKPLVQELIGADLEPATTGEDDLYLVHRESVIGADAAERHYESTAAIVRAHAGASAYLADARASRVVRLSGRELDRLAEGAIVEAGFRVLERSVFTAWVADRLAAALGADPLVSLALEHRVTDVVSVTGDREGPWRVHANGVAFGPFRHVVNALWHGRPAIDRRVGDCVDRAVHHRYRVALFVRTAVPVTVPSAIVCVGPYGDVKNYTGRDFYVSWYPAGLLASGDGIVPPPTPQIDADRQRAIVSDVFDGLGRILPGVREIRERATSLAVEGGWVYAQGHGTLDDPRSTLHRRDHLGIKWFGTYASVDTGKYSVAPYLARDLASRIAEAGTARQAAPRS